MSVVREATKIMTPQSIGIFGGTFDPIHEGHLAIAHHALKKFNLQRIEFIPSFKPPHRDQVIATPAHRLAMVRLAIQDHPEFHTNDIEIKRMGISYTIDTLIELQRQMPHSILYYLVGTDAFSQLNTWHDWKKIFTLTHLIVVNREDEKITTPNIISTYLKENQLEKNLHFLNIKSIPISATDIRGQIQSGKKIIDDLSPLVLQYITDKQLYL